MNEVDAVEATRREFEAVMRLPRFASIEQVAAGLGALADPTGTSSVVAAVSRADGSSTTPRDLPSRAPAR